MNKPITTLFLDIETVSEFENYAEFKEKSEKFEYFQRKYRDDFPQIHPLQENGHPDFNEYNDFYKTKAPLNPFYGKIVCVSLGYFYNDEETIKSFTGTEEEIINKIYKGFNKASNLQYMLCGFNINFFDIPWLNYKFIKNDVKVPNILRCFNKKPWEINSFDIHQEIKTRNVSLIEMAYDFVGYKQDFTGKEMDQFYWNGEIEKVVEHCEADVKSTIKLYQKIYELQNRTQ